MKNDRAGLALHFHYIGVSAEGVPVSFARGCDLPLTFSMSHGTDFTQQGVIGFGGFVLENNISIRKLMAGCCVNFGEMLTCSLHDIFYTCSKYISLLKRLMSVIEFFSIKSQTYFNV